MGEIDLLATIVALLCTALLVLFLGCAAPGGHDPAPVIEDDHIPEAALRVVVVILTRDDGTGNARWDLPAVETLLALASEDGGTRHILRGAPLLLADDEFYALNQQPLLHAWGPGTPGVVTLVLSRPDTTDFAGITRATGTYSDAPVLVMRARNQTTDGLPEAALILLHELGHAAGLRHGDQPCDPDTLPQAQCHGILHDYARHLAHIRGE